MCASPDMGHEIETLSIGSRSDDSEVELNTDSVGTWGSGCLCRGSQSKLLPHDL